MNLTEKQTDKEKLIFEEAKHIWDNFELTKLDKYGSIFEPYKFMKLMYLYMQNLDNKNRNLLTGNNSFINKAKSKIVKLVQQIHIPTKEVFFLFSDYDDIEKLTLMKIKKMFYGVYRKFAIDIEMENNDKLLLQYAVDYGSGFMMSYTDKSNGKKVVVVPHPLELRYELTNFKNSSKALEHTMTIRQFKDLSWIDNEKKETVLNDIGYLSENETGKIKMLDKPVSFIKLFKIGKDNKHSFHLIYRKTETVLFSNENFNAEFYKFDFEERTEYPDAIGKSIYETNFNIILDDKIKSEKLSKVSEVVSTVAFQREIENENDNLLEDETLNITDGDIITSVKGENLKPLYVGGDMQVGQLRTQLAELDNQLSRSMYSGEIAQGQDPGGNMPFSLASLLNDNQTSVHKETKKRYAMFKEKIFRDDWIPFIKNVSNDKDDIKEYISETEMKTFIDYIVNKKKQDLHIDAVIENKDFNPKGVEDTLIKEASKEKINSSDVVKEIKNNNLTIIPYISGEFVFDEKKTSYQQMLQKYYLEAPQVFFSEGFVEILMDQLPGTGISELKMASIISKFKKELQNEPNPNQ